MRPENISERMWLRHEFRQFVRDNRPLMYNNENNHKLPIAILKIMKKSLGRMMEND